MDNDKVFSIFAVTLIAGVLSVLTASVMAGIAALPTPFGFVEHLFFTVGFRAAYKSLDGPGWMALPWGAWVVTAPAAEAEADSVPGHAAGALG